MQQAAWHTFCCTPLVQTDAPPCTKHRWCGMMRAKFTVRGRKSNGTFFFWWGLPDDFYFFFIWIMPSRQLFFPVKLGRQRGLRQVGGRLKIHLGIEYTKPLSCLLVESGTEMRKGEYEMGWQQWFSIFRIEEKLMLFVAGFCYYLKSDLRNCGLRQCRWEQFLII